MNVHDPAARPSLRDLLTTSMSLFELVHDPLLPGAQGPQDLSVHYVRRKPGHGLAVTYTVYTWPAASGPRASLRVHPGPTAHLVSLTLDEQALDGTCIRFSARQVQQAAVEVQPPGVVRVRDLGLSVQTFPADSGLPALAASCDTTASGPLWQALESAACAQLGDDAWRLIAAHAEPVRYKPASRCVLRYELALEHPHLKEDVLSAHKTLTLFGKVYAELQQASFVEAMMQRLYAEQGGCKPARAGDTAPLRRSCPVPWASSQPLACASTRPCSPRTDKRSRCALACTSCGPSCCVDRRAGSRR